MEPVKDQIKKWEEYKRIMDDDNYNRCKPVD